MKKAKLKQTIEVVIDIPHQRWVCLVPLTHPNAIGVCADAISYTG